MAGTTMTPSTQVHGHRGCNDAVAANTIPAFLRAAATGCQWLEMDVVITGDEKVLVSHEPWMDHHSCRDPEGLAMTEEEGRAINIFKLPLREIQRFGCVPTDSGEAWSARPNGWYKPTLAEVVNAVDASSAERRITAPSFNIEIKSERRLYGTYQPFPDRFAELVLHDVFALAIQDRCILQSFDPAVLEAVHALAPDLPLALLVDNPDAVEVNLARLGFTPHYYSTAFSLAGPHMAKTLHDNGIGLLVWTVNEEADMSRMLDLRVDGLITDRPKRAMTLIAERQ